MIRERRLESFDYIIIGAGSSGCVMAYRLSEDPRVSVLLIEGGGPDRNPLIHVPRGFGKTLTNGRLLWSYQPVKTGDYKDPETWLRGRVLGGSSSVNGMVYVRGLPSDYDEWEALGCDGWGWSDLGRCFAEMEDHALGPGGGRGVGGPLKVTLHPTRQPLCEAMIAAGREIGLSTVEDLNELDGEGMGYQPRTIWKGRRQSAVTAFLRPARRRPNLRVVTGEEATGILFEGKRASGVRTRGTAGLREWRCHGEVVLCAGALNTPKLLQLSGIGPAPLLRSVGIEVVQDSPDVGRNLRDHRLLNAQFRVRTGSENHAFSGFGLALSVARYALFRNGPIASAAFEVGAFAKSRPDLARPDAQFGMGPMSIDREFAGYRTEPHPGALCGGYVMRPQSAGSLEVTSKDPAAPLLIDPNYLSAEEDAAASVRLFRMLRRLFAQPALAPFVVSETYPGPQEVSSDDEIIDAFHRIGRSGQHAAGTCRMGSDPRSVVDPQLRVRGFKGLRIADISIMPTLVSGNTNAPAMAMAWRASDIILAERR
ncbi:GMC oxidoreductase [Novosphingobium endophyticum]|uniref:GMC oxidoreductase n=1 Tax=Novosphingobium endophyticum TaxID=1955250 RepID=A0A916TSH5_9SPHN|nr:GMC family oxidoreductase N-terminal domain-containing protein [Novosphingobium endophyticum]GGC00746.1 GMC oxidoreductase [Novosphingobium endophyticum]